MKPTDSDDIQQYLPLLRMIDQHKEELLNLLVPNSETHRLPNYVVPGIAETKTVQMMSTLDQYRLPVTHTIKTQF